MNTPIAPGPVCRHSPYWVLDPHALTSLAPLPSSPEATAGLAADVGGPFAAGSSDVRRPLYSVHDGLAVLGLSGTLYPDSYDTLRQRLDAAIADPMVRSVVLRINSPGGAVVGVKELADHIRVLTQTKSIYAYADGLCASGAYWLAAATGSIYAPVTATLGSIGVLSIHYDWSGWNAQAGITPTYITAGTYKAVGNPDTPLSEADRDRIGGILAKIHTLFRTDVAATMAVDADQPTLWGDGQTFLAADAKALGLMTAVVTDFDHLLATLKDTLTMDPTEFAQTNPDLYAAVEVAVTENVTATLTAQAAAAQAAAVAAAVCSPSSPTAPPSLTTASVTA